MQVWIAATACAPTYTGMMLASLASMLEAVQTKHLSHDSQEHLSHGGIDGVASNPNLRATCLAHVHMVGATYGTPACLDLKFL